MQSEVENLIKLIQEVFPDSSLNDIDQNWIKTADVPKNLTDLYSNLGYGTLGNSHFAIHCLLAPEEIYDPATSENLKGVLIVGDDYAGACYAYDTNQNWKFGLIESDGTFLSLESIYPDFIQFLTQMTLRKKNNGA